MATDGEACDPVANDGKPARATPRPKNIFVLNGSTDYREWIHRLAAYNRTNAASMVDQALLYYAQYIGFDEPPPRR